MPQRRRLRRQDRSVQPRDRRREGGAAARPAGEDRLTREEVFYCHRGRHPVLMRFRTGVTQRRHASPACDLQTLLDGGAYGSYGVASTFYTGALQTVTYDIPRYRFRGCRMFTNKPPCGPKRGHGTPQPRFGQEVQLDKIAERLAARSRRAAPEDRRAAGHAHRELPAHRHHRPRRMHRARRRQLRIGREQFRKLPHGRGLGLACSSYLSGAGLPIYWNDLPHSGVQLKLDRSGGVTAFCGATEIGQGSDDVLVARRRRGARASIRSTSAPSPATPTSRRSISASYSSRVTLDDGERRDPGGRRARATCWRRRSREKLEVPGGARAVSRAPRVRRADAGAGVTFQEAVSSPRRSSGRSAPPAPTRRRKPAAQVQGRRRRPVADLLLHRRAWSRWRSTRDRLDRRPAGCGSPTTSGAR